MKTRLHYVFSLVLALICFSGFSQKNNWKKLLNYNDSEGTSKFHLEKDKVNYFELSDLDFKQSLLQTPTRGSNTISNVVVTVPGHEGDFERFELYEAPVFEPSLSAQYPEIKSYVGFGIDSPGSRLRMSVSPQGVQTMITYQDKEAVFMMPVTHGSNTYVVYNKNSRGNYVDEFVCSTIDELKGEDYAQVSTMRDADDQTLRTYRLAVSVNGEYTQYHGGTVAGALAAINATITRVNEVFETDMAIRFQLISANELIFTNPATDPYSNNLNQWNVQLQNTLTNTIGNAAYDIGHMFGASGGGGNAGCIGCVCEDDTTSTTDQNKGSGITSPADGIPEGDNFDIDYVAHEIGHQMGANHTFAFSIEGTGVNSEPGSGTTIMGYAGITGANNVQLHSDPYFHYHSINQILNNVATAPNNCATTIAIGNNPPVADAGSDYHIPPGTAYILKGSATDLDGGDTLTYCWEQTDSGTVTNSTFGPTLTSGSMNRSLPPSTSPDRYIPNWDRVVAGQLTETSPSIGSDWETVSTVARTLNWALTVRDREPTATGLQGQSSFDLTQITVENVEPFTVSTPATWGQGTAQNVVWNVGQTDNATINCQNVNIKLSTDGGLTFPIDLALNTPNDGSESLVMPSVSDTSNARILVEAADNIFYALSEEFPVSSTPDFSLINTNGSQGTCGATSVSFEFDFNAVNGFSETTTFSATGNPAGSTVVFTPSSLATSGAFTMDINNLGGVAENNYTITVTATSASITKSIDVVLIVANELCASVGTTQYETSTTGVTFNTISNLNTGKPSGYSDYTAMSTDVYTDSSYDLTVNANSDGNYEIITYAWIDWNQNCSFDDPGEQYDLGTSANINNQPTINSPLSITVPSDAALGNTVMRITTKYTAPGQNQFPTSCENGHDAEVEDYTINVLSSLSIDEMELSNFNIYPNPNNGEFTIKLNSNSGNDIAVDVFDIRGRKIFNNSYSRNNSDFSQSIKLNSVEAGMYLVTVSDGAKKITKKIIVE